jgi:hypothetical protein
MKLSDGGEKDIGKYRPALANIFEQLSEAELKQCEDSQWSGIPSHYQMRFNASK